MTRFLSPPIPRRFRAMTAISAMTAMTAIPRDSGDVPIPSVVKYEVRNS